MVRVQVRAAHRRPVQGGNPRLSVALHHAEGGGRALGGACIDQQQLSAGVDQIRIDRGLHAVAGVEKHLVQWALYISALAPLSSLLSRSM